MEEDFEKRAHRELDEIDALIEQVEAQSEGARLNQGVIDELKRRRDRLRGQLKQAQDATHEEFNRLKPDIESSINEIKNMLDQGAG
jgi:hypothetical protein